MSRSPDTTQDAHEAQVAAWRRMSGAEKLHLAVQMSDELRLIVADGIRHRHPEYDEVCVRWALFRLTLGDELFGKAFPDAPRLAP